MKKTGYKKETVRTALSFLRSSLPLCGLSLLLALISVVLTLLLPILIGDAIDGIVSAGEVDFALILPILTRAAVCILLTSAAEWCMAYINHRITNRTVASIRRQAFARLQRLPLSYLDAHPTGDVVSRIISDTDTFADGLLMGFTQFFTGILTIVGTLIFMLSIKPVIALVVVVLTPLSLFVSRFIASRTYSMFRKQSEIRGRQTALIDEMIGGEKTVIAFSGEEKVCRRFREVNGELVSASLRATFFSSLTNPTTRFVNSVVYAAVGLTGALIAMGGGLTVGALSCFLSYANQYTKPFNEISGVVTELQNALACAARVFEFLSLPAETPDPAAPLLPEKTEGRVTVTDLSFSYTPDRSLIEHVNLNVHPGDRIAIVGPTGCGKTTLINLLMRFYDPVSGEIAVDGVPTRQMTRAELRSRFGMVLQETWLRSGTVRENLRMGKPDATDAEVEEAARAVHAHGFICRLPEGYDTVIGEGGGSLSQGQKQVLCIARVMLVKPPVLVLDGATSSIDTRTELHVQRAFDRLMEGRTSFIVAHRLSTVRDATCILVMRDGKIAEQGTHAELLARNGFYAALFNSQFEE